MRDALLSRFLADVARRLAADGDADALWAEAERARASCADEDVELYCAIDDRDPAALRALLAAWESGERPLPLHDRNVLKRALKAFRKRLKLVRLDAESTVGGGPTSGGRQSGIVGVRAPDGYPDEVWELLVAQGRLRDGGHGLYELPPE